MSPICPVKIFSQTGSTGGSGSRDLPVGGFHDENTLGKEIKREARRPDPKSRTRFPPVSFQEQASSVVPSAASGLVELCGGGDGRGG